MVFVNFMMFVVFKILDNLFSMQNYLAANNCWRQRNFEKLSNVTLPLIVLSESSIHFA